jgi:hypothetical protein
MMITPESAVLRPERRMRNVAEFRPERRMRNVAEFRPERVMRNVAEYRPERRTRDGAEFRPERRMRNVAESRPERMNSPLENREVRLRGLVRRGRSVCTEARTRSGSRQSAQADFVCLLQRIHSPGAGMCLAGGVGR